MSTVYDLWHGGRDLEYDYNKPKASAKGRWEGGPGLYLTTHYETARKYSKGGGKTYKVSFELGKHLKDVLIPIDDVVNFVNSNVVVKHRKDIINDIHNNSKRMDTLGFCNAEILVNLCINYEALKGDKTVNLNRFLVSHGVDYGTMDYFSGRNETVVVLFNLEKIKGIKAIKSQDVPLEEFELNFSIEKPKFRVKP